MSLCKELRKYQLDKFSKTGLRVVLAMIILSRSLTVKQKSISLILMVLPYIIVFSLFNNIIEKRNNYLQSINVKYDLSATRAMWHNMYYGLGFLNNYFGLLNQ